jgi:hypothetical protein
MEDATILSAESITTEFMVVDLRSNTAGSIIESIAFK